MSRCATASTSAMLEAEAGEICNAERCEHSPERVDTLARRLRTKTGEVEVKMPKLRKLTFETAIIERFRRRDISIEHAIVQMYLAGVSVRRKGCSRGLMRYQGHLRHGFQSQQEGLRAYRALAPPQDRYQFLLCLTGRHRAQTQLGWQDQECLRLAGHPVLIAAVSGVFFGFQRAIRKTICVGWGFLRSSADAA